MVERARAVYIPPAHPEARAGVWVIEEPGHPEGVQIRPAVPEEGPEMDCGTGLAVSRAAAAALVAVLNHWLAYGSDAWPLAVPYLPSERLLDLAPPEAPDTNGAGTFVPPAEWRKGVR